MCGIAGVRHLGHQYIPSLPGALGAMNELQKHRGPDGVGMWMDRERTIGLGHRRLSIIDLNTGAQPMRDRAGNWITYNGEIYNYLELREELGDGTFATTSDTEVILAAYRQMGKRLRVDHLRGMFAFALWDDPPRVCFAPAIGLESSRSITRGSAIALLRVRGQSPAAVPSRHRDRRRRPPGLPDVSVLPGRTRRSFKGFVSWRRRTP